MLWAATTWLEAENHRPTWEVGEYEEIDEYMAGFGLFFGICGQVTIQIKNILFPIVIEIPQ